MILSAHGVEGLLIRCFDGRYRFRVYKPNFDFTDYDLLHTDICVTITDEDATFYSDERGNRLDHNPDRSLLEELKRETTGVKE